MLKFGSWTYDGFKVGRPTRVNSLVAITCNSYFVVHFSTVPYEWARRMSTEKLVTLVY